MLNEHVLRRRGSTLHAVDHDCVGPGLHRQCGVIVGPRRAALDVDRFLPVGDFAQFQNLDRQIVRTRPVRVAAGGTLVDSDRKRAHLGNAFGDLLAEQHSSPARLCALPHDHLDCIRPAEVIRVHAVSGRQVLVDQGGGMPALLIRHSAVAGCCGRAGLAGAPSQGLLRICGKRAETHSGDRDRNPEPDRIFGVAGTDRYIRPALFAIALKRIPRHGSPLHQEIIETRNWPLCTESADSIEAGPRRLLDVVDGVAVEAVRFPPAPVRPDLPFLSTVRHSRP